jgi:hypothetical protein
LYLEWDSGRNVPLQVPDFGTALTRALNYSTEEIVEAPL